ncbi:MAG TPA: TonB-dependent receptor [Rhizomicrobium sp.]
MSKFTYFERMVCGGALVFASAASTWAHQFNIPAGDLKAALDSYAKQSGVALMYPDDEVRGAYSKGVQGDLSVDAALTRILSGTGFKLRRDQSGALGVVHDGSVRSDSSLVTPVQLAAATTSSAALETVTVTSSKIGGDVQNIPISITALSQEQLTATQTAGGPDLVKQVPNMTFTKTNFSGYSIQLRGIGTQAISVTTDPAVAVAFNDTPFIRNHFFEQEFYDVSQVEVLRGPQGTLYGRNATAGVVNLVSAKPSDQFEAMASADIGNYGNRRFEGMINIPIVDDRADLRIAGEWTKRQGYSFDSLTDARIDGRDLWSGRMTLGWKPTDKLQTYLIWEHFSEDDDRMRTAKQLCKTAENPVTIDGTTLEGHYFGVSAYDPRYYVSQGCEATSLYSPDAFGVPNGLSLPYASAIGILDPPIRQGFDPYASTVQSQNLRVIESAISPTYRAKNDTLEFNADYTVTPALTFTSQTGYNNDFLFSAEDYNRFNTAPGIFNYIPGAPGWQRDTLLPDPSGQGACYEPAGDTTDTGTGVCQGLHGGAPCSPAVVAGSSEADNCWLDGVFCDPQVGCSDRLVAEDLSDEHAWQISQEFRFSSNFNGPFNFSAGGNYLHYETEENYYVFFNTLTHYTTVAGSGGAGPSQQQEWVPGVSDNSQCLAGGFVPVDPFAPHDPTANACAYIDPNPITHLNNEGHNYFLSQNPYALNSYAAFGEAYYNVFRELKLTAGLRWTDDQKHFVDIPSELLVDGYGYPSTGVVNQQWDQWTGRAAANWTPKLDFTDQTLIYGSYSHGYKAGGANPPGATLLTFQNGDIGNPIHPLTFKPEFIDAFELGSKNTLLDGALTINGDVFYYNYENYQISRIVDRTSINDNFDAHVKGAEIESTWEPVAGLRFNFAGGWEDTALAKGSKSVDLIDRTAGNSDWMVMKPFITQASNCVLPKYVVAGILNTPDFFTTGVLVDVSDIAWACGNAYTLHLDPVTLLPYTQDPTISARKDNFGNSYIPPGYHGFDPLSVDPNAPANVNNGLGLPPNNGQGFDKDISGNELPNAPPFTVSAGAQYTLPLSTDWAGTLRGDYYWQDYSWARVFNDRPYDRLRGYTNVNLTLIFTNQNGWQVMLYDKNIFNTTAITGDFLNSDDSGLTTNVFLTDPKLIGIRVTKNW